MVGADGDLDRALLPAVINCSECGAAFTTGPNGRNARPTDWRLIDGVSVWMGEILCPRCAWRWFGDADLIGQPAAEDVEPDSCQRSSFR